MCTAQKWSFPLRISSINVNKSAVFYEFGNILQKKSLKKTSFFEQRWHIVESVQIIQYNSIQIILFKLPFLKNGWEGFWALINSIFFFVDNPRLYKTGVQNIDQERPYETINYINRSSDIGDTPETSSNGNDYVHPYSYTDERLSKGNKNMQPRSCVQQPYIDLSDINEVSLMQCRRINSKFFLFF